MQKDAKIYVAGHRGLVGSAIVKELKRQEYSNIIIRSHKELDLENSSCVYDFFDKERPEYVFLAAAFVGGIMANNTLRADFIMRNLNIELNVIKAAKDYNVCKLLFLGSTCIYPKDAPQPIREEYLLTSPLEYTNEPYAIAKIAGLKMCESMNMQYGTNFIACMPTNLYGFNDNYDLLRGHVLPVILRKIHIAKMLSEGRLNDIEKDFILRPQLHYNTSISNINEVSIQDHLAQFGIYEDRVELWGTGKPLREFLWSEDMASACVFLMQNVNFSDLIPDKYKGTNEIRNCHINIGSGKEVSIKKLAEKVATTVDYKGSIVFDSTKPDGTMRKLTDTSKINALGWRYKVDLDTGIKLLYEDYKKGSN